MIQQNFAAPHLQLLHLLLQDVLLSVGGLDLPVLAVVGDGQLLQRLHHLVDLVLGVHHLLFNDGDLSGREGGREGGEGGREGWREKGERRGVPDRSNAKRLIWPP